MKHPKAKNSKIETTKVLGGHMFVDASEKSAHVRLKRNALAAKVGSTKGGGGKA